MALGCERSNIERTQSMQYTHPKLSAQKTDVLIAVDNLEVYSYYFFTKSKLRPPGQHIAFVLDAVKY